MSYLPMSVFIKDEEISSRKTLSFSVPILSIQSDLKLNFDFRMIQMKYPIED